MKERNHTRFMMAAITEAEAALAAGEFPVGCVLVAGDRVVATGSRKNSANAYAELDHAELVALRSLQHSGQDIGTDTITVYSTMEPCLMCFATLIVNNITNYVYGYEDVMGGGTNLPLERLAPLYNSLQINISGGVLREQCLRLFQQFFRSADNDYLKDSLLAQYTLQQTMTPND